MSMLKTYKAKPTDDFKAIQWDGGIETFKTVNSWLDRAVRLLQRNDLGIVNPVSGKVICARIGDYIMLHPLNGICIADGDHFNKNFEEIPTVSTERKRITSFPWSRLTTSHLEESQNQEHTHTHSDCKGSGLEKTKATVLDFELHDGDVTVLRCGYAEVKVKAERNADGSTALDVDISGDCFQVKTLRRK